MDSSPTTVVRVLDAILPVPAPGMDRIAEGDSESPNMRLFVYGTTVLWLNEPARVECDCDRCR